MKEYRAVVAIVTYPVSDPVRKTVAAMARQLSRDHSLSFRRLAGNRIAVSVVSERRLAAWRNGFRRQWGRLLDAFTWRAEERPHGFRTVARD